MATVFKNLSDFSSIEIPSAIGMKFGIVVSEWNEKVTGSLMEGAVNTLKKYGAEDIHTVTVPGSYELTSGAQLMIESNNYDAIICLGCVVQGETRHFDFICNAVATGITEVAVKYNKPVIFGVLTTNNLQQAIDRSGGKHGNKGDEAAVTAIKMVDLAKKLRK
ncbi:6,7-dimethyl-8-ribityllumazine synthase [Solitalea koreensis]|uniref:6,7-dimethyl-8-ribityllumazine synthase n=1 Tax=Solitalea koreensis TaxID=543615 RepID=A0A521B186_9SPHI|nr:6,7-dimethyl-8-ribityllumazine synthase [Solitalea koreensis]SMO40816.1 6,7-dimethyl-8-ribityllumazine synthase [Solitalea koreensis]